MDLDPDGSSEALQARRDEIDQQIAYLRMRRDEITEKIRQERDGSTDTPVSDEVWYREQVKSIIEYMAENREGVVPRSIVVDQASGSHDLDRETVEQAIDTLLARGELYRPEDGCLKPT